MRYINTRLLLLLLLLLLLVRHFCRLDALTVNKSTVSKHSRNNNTDTSLFEMFYYYYYFTLGRYVPEGV